MTDIIHKELGYKIMNLVFQVHQNLGPGLLESAYEEAMAWELRYAGIPFEETCGVLVFSLIY
ncbi:MAG: GxxExxY protein [Spirochaetaceae bacterium]|nr:MAG: GxxExxY protein [Spirochaetaceae bacterium]